MDNNEGVKPFGIDMSAMIQESLRLKTVEDSPRAESTGFLEYVSSDDGWNDSIRWVDDDGMPFALEGLRRFDGRAVKITIEWVPDEEAKAEAGGDGATPPLVYQAIGLTPDHYTQERKKRQAEYAELVRKQNE